MRPSLFLTIAALPVVLTAGCHKSTDKTDAPKVAAPSAPEKPTYDILRFDAGKPVPTMTLEDIDHGTTTLTKYVGKPFILYLWDSNIPDSIDSLPSINTIASEGKFPVVAVNGDVRPSKAFPDRATPILAAHNIKAIQDVRDTKNALSLSLSVALPSAILYDSAGKQVLRIVGKADFTNSEIRKALDEAK
jgi:hypothetical protein